MGPRMLLAYALSADADAGSASPTDEGANFPTDATVSDTGRPRVRKHDLYWSFGADKVWDEVVQAGDVVVDATLYTAEDLAPKQAWPYHAQYLATLVGRQGTVIGFAKQV
ncbi:hypothetical protein WJX73_010337 [Symbiochloris irregularis]|uniref:Uncharacterized protein n=1 Tax=Symbiochloris irregularis TaxID=706552 RepID=A0AAW1NTS5_9CHLO